LILSLRVHTTIWRNNFTTFLTGLLKYHHKP
jgi:hypothetical protein